MPFETSLWDDSDPNYAPLMRKIRGTYYWVPTKKYLDAGYSIKTYRLGGAEDDGLHHARAYQCRELTRQMIAWYDGQKQGKTPGTWGWLIGRYLHDPYSDIQNVRASTREKYRRELRRIEDAISEVRLRETDYSRLMEWQITMRSKGRSDAYIKKWFTHWGLALSHGVKLGDMNCLRIQQVRGSMRLKSSASRSVYARREQVEDIVADLDARGAEFASLAILMRFEFALRGVDVYGDWEPDEGQAGGIAFTPRGSAARRLWVNGMTWDMIDPEVRTLRKVISKTNQSSPDPMAFPIDQVPEIRRRLLQIPPDQRVGPVIKAEDGIPPRPTRIAKMFSAAVKRLGLPAELQLRDTRAGGITEASEYGNPWAVQQAAQHTQISTTNRYVRSRDKGVSDVVAFRQRGRS